MCGRYSIHVYAVPVVLWLLQRMRADILIYVMVENVWSMRPLSREAIAATLGLSEPAQAPVVDMVLRRSDKRAKAVPLRSHAADTRSHQDSSRLHASLGWLRDAKACGAKHRGLELLDMVLDDAFKCAVELVSSKSGQGPEIEAQIRHAAFYSCNNSKALWQL